MKTELIDKIIGGTSWENWEDTDEQDKPKTDKDGNKVYFTVPSVLACKLEWIKEYLQGIDDDTDEYEGIIDDVQDFIEAFRDDCEGYEEVKK